VVIDTLSDASLSFDLAQHFLAEGVPYISTGKRLIAESGASLASLAERCGSRFLYGAAVGGATPMIEAVGRCATSGSVAALTGVLNGTCNFVLNRCGEGVSLADALAEAQREGFAECNPVEDVSGEDTARKLSILSRHAFRAEAQVVELQRLDESIAERACEVAAHGLRLRQVGRASVCEGVVRTAVRFEEFREDSIFGKLRSEWNALQILCKNGTLETVIGRGAGRWPTTEAVLADLFDVSRARKHVTFQ
jgi:homoserine dehydrogenase